MTRRVCMLVVLAAVVASVVLFPNHWNVSAAELMRLPANPQSARSDLSRAPLLSRSQQPLVRTPPGPTIEAYVRPDFARKMNALQPVIMEAAKRHNRAAISRMSDREFAEVIAALMYNENFGSLEEQVKPLRALTPIYEDMQVRVNEMGGSNLSVWPANLRPSVAAEILMQRVPAHTPTGFLQVPVVVAGTAIKVEDYPSTTALYAAITQEITQPKMAVEYLAANLERGLYRARYEGVTVTWRTLAAWHNQGLVAWDDIRANPTAYDYVRRTTSYLPAARELIERVPCQYKRCALVNFVD